LRISAPSDRDDSPLAQCRQASS